VTRGSAGSRCSLGPVSLHFEPVAECPCDARLHGLGQCLRPRVPGRRRWVLLWRKNMDAHCLCKVGYLPHCRKRAERSPRSQQPVTRCGRPGCQSVARMHLAARTRNVRTFPSLLSGGVSSLRLRFLSVSSSLCSSSCFACCCPPLPIWREPQPPCCKGR